MKVTITFNKNTIDVLNLKLDVAKRECKQKKGYTNTVLDVCEYLICDLEQILDEGLTTSIFVADKNKVMLPSIISNFTDNIIRTNTREKAWQVDNYWRNGLSSLPSDYESIKKILYLGFPNETKRYDNESIEKLFSCVIALSFSLLETIIKSDNLVCYGYED